MKRFSARFSILAIAALVAACSSSSNEDDATTGDVGETGQDLSIGVTCTHANMTSQACQDMRNAVMAGVHDSAREEALLRAFTWIDASVMYSQARSYKGYRTDCSGFVSMAWTLPSALTTAGFAPYANGASKVLSGYSQLLPGDALNKSPRGHIFLFGGWANSAHTQMVILEESHTGAPAMMKIVASSYFDGFRPIRGTGFGSTNAGASSDSADSTSADDGSSSDTSASDTGSGDSASSGGGGQACSTDGQCNPGNNGSGLICSAGECVPGCHTSAQCPGNETCHAGSCR